jgi:hypothetical protein
VKENFFEVTVNRRSDVTSHYSKTGLNLDSCGFSTVISTKNLDKGNYTLGLYLEKGNHTSLVYSKGYNIRITDIAVVPSIEEPSPLVQLSLSKPTKTIKYIFDLYKETEDFVMVWGWGLLVNSATETGKAYLLLKKNEKVSAFDATLQLRPDITAGYGSGTINLDSSGYRFRVFKSNLEKGKYQVGLCIKKGKECGIIYSEKYIEIK